MEPRPIRHRRARRTDRAAINTLLSGAQIAAGSDERSARSRFRRAVADLGSDLYVATIDEQVVGVVHVTYARHLIDGQRAILELLLVLPAARRRGVGTVLAELAAARAGLRHCRALAHRAGPLEAGTRAFLGHLGWRPVGEQWQIEVGPTPT